jgi:N,N-dimethylformamidase
MGLSQRIDGGRRRDFDVSTPLPKDIVWPVKAPLLFAAQGSGEAAPAKPTANHFNGKIDRPRLYARALPSNELHRLVEALTPEISDPLLLGAWDFSRDIPGDSIVDVSAHRRTGRLHQMPMRGVTGANWTGYSHSWTETPLQYGAIHFHRDDLADAGWNPTAQMQVPGDWRSGFYTLRLIAGSGEDRVESYVTFFVRAAVPTAKTVVIASTATYLAYANNRTKTDQIHFEAMNEGLLIVSADDQFLSEHRELGMSTYDTHADGSGVCYSSSLRPILNGRPRSNTFNYVNDTHLLDWLEDAGIDYEVLTDEDMHREGARALLPYLTVITTSHPEYYSKEMLDALESFQNGGGRHMYLGGNGFYWRIAFHPTKLGVIEMRRDIAGTRSWEGEAGENSLSFTGEPSGLWRSCGRAPQRLVGVGFDAQVFDRSSSYRRCEGSFDPSVSFVMAGVEAEERIGDFGLRLGGAAGLEIDRADMSLGSPPNLVLLATADRMGTGGLPTPEEMPAMYRGMTGEENALVRADMVFFPTANGGAVFATGSIAWCCSLSHNRYDNNVSRITGNVLRRFLDPTPFEAP